MRGHPPEAATVDAPLVAFDGRIDNRSALLDRLGTRAEDCPEEEQLVAALLARFGERILPDILGDFAFAVWNPGERTLLLARDVSGVRPLCYYDDGTTLFFASEMSAIFSLPSFRPVVNERKVAQYLVASMQDRDETVYRGVMRVPPAHLVVASLRSTSVRRYFDFDVSSTLRYQTDREYAGHFLDLLRESLKARLPEGERCGAELSGGLDSSSIVCTAAALGRSIEAFSLVFPGLRCDESEEIDLVARHANVKSHRFTPTPRTRDDLDGEIDRIHDVPDAPNGAMHDGVYRQVTSSGIRILLAGLGGDDLFDAVWNRSAALEALACAEARRWFRDFDAGDLFLGGRDLLARTWMGTLVRPIWRRVRPPRGVPWILPATSTLASGDGTSDRQPHEFRTATRLATHESATAPWLQYTLECVERSAARRGIALRFPFLDRRIVQFAISVPQEQRSKLGIDRYVVREAMRGILPERTRTRTTKAEFGVVFNRELQVVVDDSLELGVLDRWVETSVLDGELRTYLASLRRDPQAMTQWGWQFWESLAVCAWLNRLFPKVG
ncbi:MAG: asparagine synthase-related protein [Thermoanaerobaculia bacterium]|nr:asparagine synthase-related protein [Thermoanaerobaculia bacterium]